MSKTNKIASNAFWIIGVKVIQSVLAFLIYLFTARYLGPSNYGLISYAASLVSFATPIMNLGLTNVLVQEFINNPDNEGEILGSTILMSLLSSLFCVIGVTTFSVIANPGEQVTITVCALYSLLLVFQAFESIQYWFQAHYLSKYSSIVTLAAYVVTSIYKIFLLATGKSVYWFVAAYIIEYFIIAISLFILLRIKSQIHLKWSNFTAKHLFSKSRHYIASTLMIMVFVQTDKIMLKSMMGADYTGYYSAATTCATLSQFVFTAIIDSFRPAIFEGKIDSIEKYKNRISQLYCIIIYLSLAQCVFMTLFAKPIILLLFGSTYAAAIPVLRIAVWYTTFSYMGTVRNIWILAENYQKYLWIINLSGAVANVCLNAVLIPVVGVKGAAIASLVTQFFANIVMNYIIKPLRPNNQLIVRGLDIRLITNFIDGMRKNAK